MAEIKKLFAQVFNKNVPLSPRVLDMIFSLFNIYTIEKGNEIVSQGRINSKEYFLLSGFLHEFTCDEKGNETTLDFYPAQSTIVPNFCRTINNRSILTVQALTKSIVAEIDTTVFVNARNEYAELDKFSSSVIINLYRSKLQKQIFHATKSGKGKLEQLRKDFPGIENQIPLTYIASYLGITNVSLSRLRNKK
jgi:CRP-like cAMP-binding protein